MEEQVIRISVRNLVEFVLQSGDIDNRTSGKMDKEAMQMGSRIHRKIQRRMGSSYHAEVPVKIQVACEGFILQVEGRADGVIEETDGIMIDEIKGILGDIERLKEPVGIHLAQAKCYAYMIAKKQNLETIKVQMTYCQMESEELKQFQSSYRYEELEHWFLDVVKKYEKWAKFQIEWRKARNASIKGVEFPFDYREGQKHLVTSVYRTILRKKKLFIQAPTGVGKTMASVFPAVKAVGEGLGEKIFYLTAKTITRTVAEQAFETLRGQHLRMKTITLTAKEKICFLEKAECNPEACPYAKGHYDRVNDAVFELLQKEDFMSREVLEAQARTHNVCPFELSLDASTWVDAVVCDYNYVFDPNAHLKRFFQEGIAGEYLFLVDEAHNLVERGREMYSAVLYKEDFLALKKAVKFESPKLARFLDGCNKQMLEWKRECGNYEIHKSVSVLALKLLNVMSEMEKVLEFCDNQELREKILDLYFQIRMFLYVHERLDENYIIYTELEKDNRFKVKLYCVNPANNLQEYLSMGNSTVFFSATLLPVQYYKKLLSTKEDDYAIYAESPFEREKRLLVLGNDVSSKYTLRGPQMYQRYVIYLYEAVTAKTGNYMAFFPSYHFMEEVYEAFQIYVEEERIRTGIELDIESIVQGQYMSETAREIFLESFEEEREGSLIGFCVMGGIFSEGIDLKEETLIGAFIVGTGLPQVCNDREILKQYFDSHGMDGFSYAYLYPGMNKVLQAAGRVIRTEEDKGVIMLLDERFMQRQYQEIFPREWDDMEVCSRKEIGRKIEGFWTDKNLAGKV